MPGKIKKLTAILIVSCLINSLYSQQYNYQFSHLEITKGLSHNRVTCIYKDKKGFMWFGTISGLNKYDGYGFKVFMHDNKDSSSLFDNYILKLFELPDEKIFVLSRTNSCIYDPSLEKFLNTESYFKNVGLPEDKISSIAKTGNDFWFLFADSGLYKLSATKSGYASIHVNNSRTFSSISIADIKSDSKDNLILAYNNGVIEKLNTRSNKVFFSTDVIAKQLNNQLYDFSVYVDKQDAIWLYVAATPFGAFYLNPFTNETKKLSKENGILNNDILSGIVQDNKGLIWIGTDHGGVNVIDKRNFKTSFIKNREDDNTSISQNVITTLYKDNLGIIWLGTYKRGINYYHEDITKFPLYRHLLSDKNSLNYDDVNRFAEDAKGNIWIGTNGGGLIYFDRHSNKFTQYKHDSANANSISNDVIVSLCIDHEEKLWIGSYYGGLDCYDGKNFIHYKHDDANGSTLSDDRVWEIYEDKENNLWIGTFSGGLDRFNRAKKIFYHYKKESSNAVSSDYITSFTEDANGNLWIGTDAGINLLNKQTGKFNYYTTKDGISNDDIISLLTDDNKNIWIGTRNGLSVFNNETKTFQSFNTQNGLPDNSILNILEDNSHNLWISTPHGLAKIFIYHDKKNINITCKNYDEQDGLQSRDFNENAAYKTRSGELIFGGANGFNIFNPAIIRENKNVPQLAFTDFQLFNKSIAVGKETNDHVILSQSISYTKDITLRYNENNFSVEFVALSYDNANKNLYSYKLEGFNDEWLTSSAGTRRATYTNLDPGEYTFTVKASNDDGFWNNKGISLKIIILPPFWKTPVAYGIYMCIIIVVLFFARRMVIHRARMRFALEQERKEAQRMHELDMMKIKFFTNVSHEFKTPLSLILSPIEKIVKTSYEPEQKKQFQLIHRNAKRLLHLVNQLLDFRRMEVQELTLNSSKGDVAMFIKDVCCSFTDLAERKHIKFFYTSYVDHLITNFDHDKIERILFNLLSNAFKFTPQNGSVSVEINMNRRNENVLLEIIVKDTGIGIPKDKKEKIFERFFQTEIPGSLINQGSGIGLAITKEFVKMHNGSISVESEIDRGSCFTVLIPFAEINEEINDSDVSSLKYSDIASSSVEEKEPPQQPSNKTEVSKEKKQIILIVEDNEDFRFYLKDNLKMFYNVIEAPDGKQGWQQVLSMHPALVVSDISMPVMNGIELCKKIKSDTRTKHTPVILLTALAGEEKHLQGLEIGASDYMTKPFNSEILTSRIRNILNQQNILKKTFVRHVEAKPSDVKLESPDEKFMQQALVVIERNLSNPEFSVEDLSRELFISRVAMYKRIFTLTGKSPLDFIRSMRLKRAAQLLEKSDLTVAEVAYEVGFNNPKYFSRLFKAEYNLVPTAFQTEKKKKLKQVRI